MYSLFFLDEGLAPNLDFVATEGSQEQTPYLTKTQCVIQQPT